MEFEVPITQRRKAAACTYPISDRKAIEPYKKDYRLQINKALRGQIFRTKILPAIFNHWRADGREPTSDLESAGRIKVLKFSTINKFVYMTISDTLRMAFKQLETHGYARGCSEIQHKNLAVGDYMERIQGFSGNRTQTDAGHQYGRFLKSRSFSKTVGRCEKCLRQHECRRARRSFRKGRAIQRKGITRRSSTTVSRPIQ